MQGNLIEEGFCSGTGINCLSCYSTIYQRCHVNLIEKPVKEYSLDRRYQSEDELFKKLQLFRMINITTFFLYRRFLMELEHLQLHHYRLLLMLRVCWWDMIHHHDYQLLTVQKEVLHIPLWGSLVLVQEKFQQLILQGLQRYHLRQSIKLIFVMLSKQKLYRKAKSLSKRVNEYSANMASATPTAFLVFYRFKAMSDQEAQKSSAEWNDLKKSLPSDVRLAGEYNHAWGTEYNGFLLFEADNTNSFLDWWSSFKDKIRWYVDQTHTIVARRRT